MGEEDRLQLRHLRYLVGVMDAGSFSAASVQLGISQPALSSRIAELEEELEVLLFVRSRRGIEPTVAGAAFIDDARALLRGLDRAGERARLLARGNEQSIRFGEVRSASRFAYINKAVHRYMRSSPHTPIHAQRSSVGPLTEAMKDGRLDAVVTYAEALAPDQFSFIPIHVERIVMAIPSSHRLATKDELRMSDLASIPLISMERASNAWLYDALANQWKAHGIEPEIVAMVDSTDTLSMVRAGVGGMLVSSSTTIRADCTDIVVKEIADFDLPLNLIFAWNGQSPEMRKFVDFFHSSIAAHQRLLARSGQRWARLPVNETPALHDVVG